MQNINKDSKKSPRGYRASSCGSLGELDSPGNTGGRCAGTADNRGQQKTGKGGKDHGIDKRFAVEHWATLLNGNNIKKPDRPTVAGPKNS